MKISYCTLFSAFVLVLNLCAQEYVPVPADISRFPDTKTIMVLEDNLMSEYNLIMDETVPREWIATPYEFSTWKKFEIQRKDRSLSFLILNRVSFEKDKSNARYMFMSLLLGGRAGELSGMPDLCSIPLAYYGAPEETYT